MPKKPKVTEVKGTSGFVLGERSRKRLIGVDKNLVRVVEYALKHSEVDFTVLEGVRTLDRQRQLVRSGASQTMNSRHLTGHAVDLGALVGGQVRWDWPLYYKIGDAMIKASKDLKIPIRWGGAWHVGDIGNQDLGGRDLSDSYVDLRKSQGRRYFLDGPHFEIPR